MVGILQIILGPFHGLVIVGRIGQDAKLQPALLLNEVLDILDFLACQGTATTLGHLVMVLDEVGNNLGLHVFMEVAGQPDEGFFLAELDAGIGLGILCGRGIFGGDFVDELVPGIVLGLLLTLAAGGQNDLDARRLAASRSNGDVEQIGRIDTALESRRQLFRLDFLIALLALVHLVDEDSAADQIDTETEFAVIVGPGDNRCRQQHRHHAKDDPAEIRFHDWTSCLST